MRLRIAATALATAAAFLAFVGCGSERNVGTQWAEAVDDEAWDAACALMIPRGGCEQRLQRRYAGREVRLLDAGEYQEGSNVTDNETRFALTAEAGGRRATTYYEIERRNGRNLVDVKIVIEGR